MEPAQPVELGFFPLDEELELLPGNLTPTQHEHLVHLATWMPFAQAGNMLGSLLGVQVSEATVRRMTEQAGAHSEQVQTAQSQQAEAPICEGKAGQAEEKLLPVPLKQAISSDGAYVPLISGEWAEVRTLAIAEVGVRKDAQGQEHVKQSHLSYFSRMTDATTFEQLCEVEIRHRRVREALSICAVTDGAIWLQHFVDLHRPDAVRILDFPHAAEYVHAIGEGVRAQGYRLPEKWLEGVLHRLKHEGPSRVLEHLGWLCQRCRDPELDKKLRYLSSRVSMMQYPTFQQQGWPIGSGMVESANKVVMQMRLKGPGMRWEPTHVNPMLALRTAVCNDRWSLAWYQTQRQYHHRRLKKQQNKATPRLTQLLASTCLLLLQYRPSPPRPVSSSSPASVARMSSPPATLPGSSRPSAHHPWKRGPACRPSLVAKK